MQRSSSSILLLPVALVAMLTACSSEEDAGTSCTPLAASAFPCTDPDQCLSVTAAWCFAGASDCTTIDVELSLEFPDDIGDISGATINRFDTTPLYGCVHDGDETAEVPVSNDGILGGPYDENITCSPYPHATPPDRIDSGTYYAIVQEDTIFDTEARVDINVNGQTSCQVFLTADFDKPPVRIPIDYP